MPDPACSRQGISNVFFEIVRDAYALHSPIVQGQIIAGTRFNPSATIGPIGLNAKAPLYRTLHLVPSTLEDTGTLMGHTFQAPYDCDQRLRGQSVYQTTLQGLLPVLNHADLAPSPLCRHPSPACILPWLFTPIALFLRTLQTVVSRH